jgi:hypothetical protein
MLAVQVANGVIVIFLNGYLMIGLELSRETEMKDE